MFFDAVSFNKPIAKWDTSNNLDMSDMFKGASSFNQPIGSWDVTNVSFMTTMFKGASSFNQNLDNWFSKDSCDKCVDFDGMFHHATSFNQDFSNWFVFPYANINAIFLDTGITLDTYCASMNSGGSVISSFKHLAEYVTVGPEEGVPYSTAMCSAY